jgi:hypothetical protein
MNDGKKMLQKPKLYVKILVTCVRVKRFFYIEKIPLFSVFRNPEFREKTESIFLKGVVNDFFLSFFFLLVQLAKLIAMKTPH